jgi:hypothetical protein
MTHVEIPRPVKSHRKGNLKVADEVKDKEELRRPRSPRLRSPPASMVLDAVPVSRPRKTVFRMQHVEIPRLVKSHGNGDLKVVDEVKDALKKAQEELRRVEKELTSVRKDIQSKLMFGIRERR